MRFWQAMLTAEMAAGSVYADRFRDPFWLHWSLDAGNLVLGAILWLVCKKTWGSAPHPEPAREKGK